MRAAYRADDIRAAEAPLLAAGVPLMRQAARAVATRTISIARARRAAGLNADILVLVGGGNNGGDGLWAAHDLAQRGLAPVVLLATDHPHAEGLAAARGAGVQVVTRAELGEDVAPFASWFGIWLDALAGIGLSGPLRGELGELVAALAEVRQEAPRHVIAVDTPSGLADDPAATNAIRADETHTFAAAKPALLLPPACRAAGTVVVHDLGIPLDADPAVVELDTDDISQHWPRAGHLDHKYTRGVVGIDAGSATYPGAGILATRAALAAGPGMVRFLGDRAIADRLPPEVVTAPGRIQAGLVGSGTEGGPDIAAALRDFRERDIPVVVDAGALACRDELGAGPGQLVLTPHLGELATLLGDERAAVEADPVRYARAAATEFAAVVVAKGPETVIAAPTGPVYTTPPGSPWLATAGSGDVLAGALAAALAQFAARSEAGEETPPLAAQAALAVALHAHAVDYCPSAPGPIRASDLADALGPALGALLAGQ